MSLTLVPISLREANAFCIEHHRTHGPRDGAKFAIGLANEKAIIVGVAIVARPVARMLDDGFTLEVARTCTDGTKNANSMLYGACWRAARAMGYRKLITYTLPSESGSSLRAGGWKVVAETRSDNVWSRESRPRVDIFPAQMKLRWELEKVS